MLKSVKNIKIHQEYSIFRHALTSTIMAKNQDLHWVGQNNGNAILRFCISDLRKKMAGDRFDFKTD